MNKVHKADYRHNEYLRPKIGTPCGIHGFLCLNIDTEFEDLQGRRYQVNVPYGKGWDGVTCKRCLKTRTKPWARK